MASAASTPSAIDGIRFAPDFVANIPTYERAIRRHRVTSWARQRSLDDDLVQLTLVGLARMDARFDPTRASSPHHFRLAVLGSRVSDSARLLRRMHSEVTLVVNDELDADSNEQDSDGALGSPDQEPDSDPVLESIARQEAWQLVAKSITALPPRQRQVIDLALQDQSDKEIAAHVGVTIQSVNKTRLAAIENLKRTVGAQFRIN